jgi:lipoprotein-releasing system permease protein
MGISELLCRNNLVHLEDLIMIDNWRCTVALRLFGSNSSNRLMSFVGLLSVGGLAVAVAILVTVLSVVNGFERELRERVLAVLPHGTVYSRTGFEDWRVTRSDLLRHHEVLGVAPVVEGQGLLVVAGELTGVVFRGIDPEFEPTVSILPEFVEHGVLEQLANSKYGTILGAELARQLGVSRGDQVSLVLPDVGFSLTGPVVTTRRLTVLGTFEVGADIDKTHIYLNMVDAQKLKRQSGIDGLVLRIPDLFDIHKVLHAVSLSDPSLYGVSWMRQNGSLYNAIGTQKATLFLLLFVLVAVAVFNVVSNLVMTVDDNRSEIAILRTMGASPGDLRWIFIMHGLMVGVVGLLLGLLMGLALTLSLGNIYAILTDWFQLTLMQEYFIRYLPTQILVEDLAIISVVSLVISFLATIYPASRAAVANPVEALQYEV